MKLKTISGHYDTAFDLSHNNRDFVPGNVDVNRIPRNYNCVAACKEAYLDRLAITERERLKANLADQIRMAENKKKEGKKNAYSVGKTSVDMSKN